MDYTLTHLIDSLQSTLKILRGDANAQLVSELHDHDKLPSKKLAGLASQAVDLLHETEQLLEPGSLVLADHFLGYVNSKCLTAAVQLNIPDTLRAGPKNLSDLASACNARPDRLGQVLRVLYNNGIFAFEKSSGSYRNNTTSNLLLSDHWTQWRNWIDLYGNEFYDMARGIPASCSKDAVRMPAQIEFDTDLDMFTYFTNQGWLPRLHKTLSGGAIAQAPGILEDYPWEEIAGSTFLDVGGGGGGLVALVLRKHKSIQAGILDLPKVIDHARTNFHSSDGQYFDVGDRVADENLIAGDFLLDIPKFEVYTMKWCLHDWDDSKALKILKNVRDSIIRGSKSRLIIFESILTDGCMGRLSRYGDITMMVSANGQERDEAQWRDLAEQTGWEMSRIFPLRNSWPCAIELVPFRVTDGDFGSMKLSNGILGAENPRNPIDSCGTIESKRGDPAEGRTYVSQMSYLEPWDASRGEPFFRSAPDEGFESTNLKWTNHQVEITDARPAKDNFDLDKEGFIFCEDQEGLRPEMLDVLRSNNNEIIQKMYYPQVESLVKRNTGATRVIIFDSTVRKKIPSMDPKENPNGQEQPATVASAHLNSSLQTGCLLFHLHRHQFEERGQTVAFSYADDQKWYYLDGHGVDEVTMIKIWDNDENVVGKFCPHAAFDHPDSPPNALPRESVEVRCFAIWD
ncbi:MAG: hypothetical protein ASARMPREDX12_002203 [Alectoria sarmentosa]|nr:MAG: hypothetical protein ASARMPREDX12_002203 [Alectoria sarmentosa]